jgi:putative phage-type endonuclease
MMDDLQRTESWFGERLGKVTASRVADVLAKTKSGPSASRANYAAELVAERLTGRRAEGFTSAAMQRGTDLEPLARDAYSFISGHTVIETGFVVHPAIAMTGASPDGLIGDDGLVEIKCCGAARHIAVLKGDPAEDRYVKQMLWQMACTGRQWCDLAYYNPDLPVELQLKVIRIDRDDAAIAAMEAEISAFLAEVAADVAYLQNLKEAA